MTFNPNEHLIKIKTKRGMQDYLNIQARLMWFRDMHPHGAITTELVQIDLEKQIAIFKAHVEDGQGGIGEGYGSESVTDFPDYIEKASTKAIGRALLVLGFGTCFAGEELDEQHRIVDAPVEHKAAAEEEPVQPEPIDSMKMLVNKCRNRAFKLGFDKIGKYEKFCMEIIGKREAETLVDINKLNIELMSREQKSA